MTGEMVSEVVITGWPVRFEDLHPRDRQMLRDTQDRLGIPPVYYEGSLVTTCPQCRIEMYLGPRSREQYEQAPDQVQVLCIVCVARWAAGSGVRVTLRTLGNEACIPRQDL